MAQSAARLNGIEKVASSTLAGSTKTLNKTHNPNQNPAPLARDFDLGIMFVKQNQNSF